MSPFQVGQQLILELSNGEMVTGKYLTSKNKRMDLTKLQEYPSRETLTPRASFNHYEIVAVALLKDDGTVEDVQLEDDDINKSQDVEHIKFVTLKEVHKLRRQARKEREEAQANGSSGCDIVENGCSDDTTDSNTSSVKSIRNETKATIVEVSTIRPKIVEEVSDKETVEPTPQPKIIEVSSQETIEPTPQPKIIEVSNRNELLKFKNKKETTAKPAEDTQTVQSEEVSSTQQKLARLIKTFNKKHNITEDPTSKFDQYEEYKIKRVPVKDLEVEDTYSYEEFKECVEFNSSVEDSRQIALRSVEFERLKDLAKLHWYINNVDSNTRSFQKALWKLNNSETIGIVGIGSERGRMSPLTLLVLTTWDRVYVLDLLTIRSNFLWVELRVLLENSDIKKVIYDSRMLVDCFHHNFEIDLKNVFDLQLADLAVRKQENRPIEPLTLADCLSFHLHMPNTLFKLAEENREKFEWTGRPLTQKHKIHAAVLGAPLIALKNKLEKKLMRGFYDAVDVHSQSLKKYSNKDFPNGSDSFPVRTEVVAILDEWLK